MISRKLRKEILERDNYQCQFDKIFGISEISGINGCTGRLELHHRTYKRYGKELPEDLITVCKKHHDILTNLIRGQYYIQKNYTLKDVKQMIPQFNLKEDTYEKVSMQDHRNNTPGNAQGRHGRPAR